MKINQKKKLKKEKNSVNGNGDEKKLAREKGVKKRGKKSWIRQTQKKRERKN